MLRFNCGSPQSHRGTENFKAGPLCLCDSVVNSFSNAKRARCYQQSNVLQGGLVSRTPYNFTVNTFQYV